MVLLLLFPIEGLSEFIRGIYITQPTMESTKNINHIIKRAKETGINTFVVDVERVSKSYATNTQLLQQNNIHYIARLVVFPKGGTQAQISSEAYWEKKYVLAAYAASLGAEMIQLDYIRYNTKRVKSQENAKNILKVIEYFRQKLSQSNTKLQVAVFGEVSFGPSMVIGQDVKEFYSSIDSVAPMVYPSHYFPYVYHSKRPYETIYTSLTTLRGQFNNVLPFKLYPYIEVSNVRYRIGSATNKMIYIFNQIKAVQDSGADGWYAWSPQNKYNNLFNALEYYKKELH